MVDAAKDKLSAMGEAWKEYREEPRTVEEVLEAAADKLSKKTSHFSQWEFYAAVAHEAQVVGTGPLVEEAREYLESSRNIERLGISKGELRYTTRAAWEEEAKLLKTVDSSRETTHHCVREHTLSKALSKVEKAQGFALSDEQRRAVEDITRTAGSVKVVEGFAGVGKTTMLNAARETWEQEGMKVLGCALAGKASTELQKGAGIKSDTMARLLIEIERLENPEPDGDTKGKILAAWRHATWQVDGKTARKMAGEYYMPTTRAEHEVLYATRFISKAHRNYLNSQLAQAERRERYTIDSRTIVVVDEATMVDNLQAARLTHEVVSRGGKLVVVKSDKQLQAIGPGGAFKAVGEMLGESRLENIVRQREVGNREAVRNFERGEALLALTHYAERGNVQVSSNQHQAARKLVSEWEKHGGVSSPKDHLIVAPERSQVAKLNAAAQEKARVSGELGEKNLTANGILFFEGDRILFTRNDKKIGVDNGNLGTIESVNRLRNSITVILDRGERVFVSLSTYKHVELGYAVTTHKAQSGTCENVYVLASGRMLDLHQAYVMASRARGEARFYTTRTDAGDKLTDLAKTMSRDRQKTLAHDVAMENELAMGLERMRDRTVERAR